MLLMLNTDKMNKRNEEGQKHGVWEEYYSNGNIWYKGNYVNGQKHGLWEWYWFNGKLNYKKNYVNGQLHGLWGWYHSNGNLEEIRYHII